VQEEVCDRLGAVARGRASPMLLQHKLVGLGGGGGHREGGWQHLPLSLLDSTSGDGGILALVLGSVGGSRQRGGCLDWEVFEPWCELRQLVAQLDESSSRSSYI